MVLLVLLTIVGAPIVEELFFRGLVLRSLRRHIAPPAAIVVSALLFALVHFQVLQFLALAIFGVIAAHIDDTGRPPRPGYLGPRRVQRHHGHHVACLALSA